MASFDFLFGHDDRIYFISVSILWVLCYISSIGWIYYCDPAIKHFKKREISTLPCLKSIAKTTNNQQTSISIDGGESKITKDTQTDQSLDVPTFCNANTRQRAILSTFLIIFLTYSIFDRLTFGVLANDKEYLKQFGINCIIVIIGHLLIEFALNRMYKMPFSVTACIRDVVNNIALIITFILTATINLTDSYLFWLYDYWVPIVWGCYVTDLIMILLFWHGFQSSWRKFVIIHHTLTGGMILLCNHVNSNNNINISEFDYFWPFWAIFMYFESNNFGVIPEIFKYYKLFENASHIIIPIFYFIQRLFRIPCYLCALTLPWNIYWTSPVNYFLLVLFGFLLDAFDHFMQTRSTIKFYLRRRFRENARLASKLYAESHGPLSPIPSSPVMISPRLNTASNASSGTSVTPQTRFPFDTVAANSQNDFTMGNTVVKMDQIVHVDDSNMNSPNNGSSGAGSVGL